MDRIDKRGFHTLFMCACGKGRQLHAGLFLFFLLAEGRTSCQLVAIHPCSRVKTIYLNFQALT